MRYLTLSADYGALSLRDGEAGSVDLADVDLPGGLARDLLAWNSRYEPIVAMDMAQRESAEVAALITKLDELGLALARRLADALGDRAKVMYYSEGGLRLMP